MDIGVPFRDLGKVSLEPLAAYVAGLDEAAWTRNPLRQDLFADGVHSVTQAIIFKHEWHPSGNSVQYRYLEDLIHAWSLQKKIDPGPYMPVERQDTDIGAIYTFPDWFELQPIIQPVVDRVVEKVRTPRGVVARVALVRMSPGGKILPHIDSQVMATRAHRLHIPIVAPPGVEYKIGGRKLVMEVGHVYDFNNRVRHSVRHAGKRPRINLFVDYYAQPGLYVPPAHEIGPMFARNAARVVT